eukprot:CAMPEP_0170639114 /NCGR_PEP_ID=MMETSP0224-20130122/39455_1 /TAXON_ID=285029 /ORGANISM="Togula jolla, Strain CCCM 725" /LENGTH=38 /DNA_ID= /DNA_START= /DNA_END= /DNA_ORIENTATION=
MQEGWPHEAHSGAKDSDQRVGEARTTKAAKRVPVDHLL